MFNNDSGQTWYSKLTDAVTMRRMEATAHVASWVAVSLTALIVGASMATESNPFARWLIEAVGMRGFGVLAAVLVSVSFRMLAWADTDSDGRFWHVFGGLFTSVLVTNAATDAWAVAEVGLPESVLWADLAVTSALIGVTALVCYYRLGRRAVDRAARIDRRAAAKATASAGIVVMASVAPLAGLTSPVGDAAGQSGTIVLDDFEDGDLSEYGNSDAMSIVSTETLSGQYSAAQTSDYARYIMSKPVQPNQPESFSFDVRFSQFDTEYNGRWPSIGLFKSDGSGGFSVQFRDAGNVYVSQGDGDTGTNVDTGLEINKGETYTIYITNIDYTNNEVDITIQQDGNTIGEAQDIATNPQTDNPLSFLVDGNARWTVDNVKTGTTPNIPGPETEEAEIVVRDNTEYNLFANPTTVTAESKDETVSGEFNTYNKTSLELRDYDGRHSYELSLRAESGAIYEGMRVWPGANEDPSPVYLRPGSGQPGDIGNRVDATAYRLQVQLDARTEQFREQYDNATAVTFNPPDPVTQVNYTIVDGDGNTITNETREFDEPTSNYTTLLPKNETNGTVPDDATLDYGGTFENGTTFSGSTGYSSATASPFGPTGSGGGGGGSPLVGVALVGGVGYLSYRRFGSGQLGSAVSSAVGRLRP